MSPADARSDPKRRRSGATDDPENGTEAAPPAPSFRPVPVVAPAEQIRSQVVDAISKGHLRPGDRLPAEGNLAREFGVSSAQVRTGLNELVSLGLIEIARGRGGGLRVARPDARRVEQTWHNSLAVLADLSDVSLAELAEARREVETICARAAASRRTADDLRHLADAIDDSVAPGLPTRDWLALDIVFHRAVANAAHNKVLTLPLVAVHSVSQPRLNELIADRLDRDEVTAQHRAIYEAIASGSGDAAAEAVRAHVAYLEALYVEVAESAQSAARKATRQSD